MIRFVFASSSVSIPLDLVYRVPTNLESQGESGNLGGQGKSGKSQGILDGVREKEEKT